MPPTTRTWRSSGTLSQPSPPPAPGSDPKRSRRRSSKTRPNQETSAASASIVSPSLEHLSLNQSFVPLPITRVGWPSLNSDSWPLCIHQDELLYFFSD